MKPIFDPVRINLVEHEEWKPYDSSEKLGDFAFHAAAENIGAMGKKDVIDLAEDVLSTGRKWSRSLTGEEEEAIWHAFDTNQEVMQPFNQFIMDAMTWDYEQAAVPRDSDIEYAIERAIDALAEEDFISGYDALEEGEHLLGYYKSKNKFIKDILKDSVRLEREEGHYDRFLVYDPPSKAFLERLKQAQGLFFPVGVLEWAPSISLIKNQAFVYELQDLIKSMKDNVVEETFTQLKKIMDDVDYGNRGDFFGIWRERLKDKSEVKAAKDALLKVLRDASKGVLEWKPEETET